MDIHKVDILKITDVARDVKSFRLSKPIGFSFIPGQYCMFNINTQTRPFTLSNSPTEDYLEITIKLMHNATKQLFAMKKGDTLGMQGPHGEALNFDENVKEDVVFIAGGSGITPFMSALRYANMKKLSNQLFVFYSNKTFEDIIIHAELDKLPYEIIYSLTESHPVGWKGEIDYINAELVKKYVKNINKYLWYICGPPPMTEAMKKLLTELGISNDKWRIEPWELPGK